MATKHDGRDKSSLSSKDDKARYKVDYTAYFANRLNGCSVSVPTAPKPPTTSDKGGYVLQNSRTAEAALKDYNAKNAKNYTLVKTIVSVGRVRDRGLWFHCNFTAKLPNALPKLFFAEMKIAGPKQYNEFLVTACLPLEGRVTKGCEMCSAAGGLQHPVDGFRQGIKRRVFLRSRVGGKVAKSRLT